MKKKVLSLILAVSMLLSFTPVMAADKPSITKSETETTYTFSVIAENYDNCYVYVAIYDANNALLNVNREPIEAGAATVSVDKLPSGALAKVFIWQDNMKPVTDKAEEFALIPVPTVEPTTKPTTEPTATPTTEPTAKPVTWDFDEATGALTISGTGKMTDYYTSSQIPWDDNRSDIKSVVIENGVTSIGTFAFYNCIGLESVTIPNSVTSIGNYAFNTCTGLTSVTIPYGVTSIGYGVFDACANLADITIPDSVESIGDRAFYNTAYYNDEANWDNDGVLYIGKHLIKAKSDTIPTEYTIKEGTKTIASEAFHGCTSLTGVTIPDGITSIGNDTFHGCKDLTSVTIPDGVTSIGSQAFWYCTGLESVIIPDSVTSIGGSAFRDCSKLTSITIPDGITSINPFAFDGCTSLESVTIPDGVTSIGNAAFQSCTSLTAVNYFGSKEEWDKIDIGTSNEPLQNAKIVYNYVKE